MNIALLFGGQSYEHEVSLTSASYILKELIIAKHNIYPIAVQKNGTWLICDLDTQIPLAKNNLPLVIPTITNEETLNHTAWTIPSQGIWYNLNTPVHLNIDCVFPIIHGYSGEDGLIQGLLELAELPFTGCNSTSSAIGMNKHIAKALLTTHNLQVTPSVTLFYTQYIKNSEFFIKKCVNQLELPIIIKPSDGGSSVGIFTAHNMDELKIAIQTSFEYTNILLLEPLLSNIREIETSVIQKGDKIQTFPPGEVVIPSKQIYNYDLKYNSNHAQSQIPVQLDPSISSQIQALSEQVFIALNGDGYMRIDFFLKEDNTIVVNEVNTIPGFTPISMFPKIVSQRMCSKDLIEYLIQSGIEAYKERNRKNLRE